MKILIGFIIGFFVCWFIVGAIIWTMRNNILYENKKFILLTFIYQIITAPYEIAKYVKNK